MIALLVAVAVLGSKQFTESVIVSEIAVQALERAGVAAEHRRELGGTRVLFEALRAGQIDAYPEYTGTLAEELLRGAPDLDAALAAQGLRRTGPIGFDDAYALGMRRAEAERLGVETLSELARHPALRFGLTNEFLERRDGWPRLRAAYGFTAAPRGMQHEVAYAALERGALDVIDLYSTDAEIRLGDLRVLRDDRGAFPRYAAIFLYRAALAPEAVRALSAVRIGQEQMIAMNARARLEHVPEAQIAASFLGAATASGDSRARRIARRTAEHLLLVGVALAAAIALALPLGVLAFRLPRLGAVLLGVASVLQTIPSLALLVFMIPLFGIGAVPAILALFLYALLPILRGTQTGLTSLAPELRESALALGLPPRARLFRIELPLASRSILAGIKTAAVITVGTATLGALIGAGGYGQPILSGIRLADTGQILEGAVPAALMALAVQALFAGIERVAVPRGLRLK